MIESLTAGAFVAAILLMCGPQACYNAGTWIGIALKALWKAVVWLFGATKRTATMSAIPIEPTGIERVEPVFAEASNIVPLKSKNGPEANDRQGQVIDGIATVL